MKNTLIYLLLSFMLATSASGKTITVSREASGYGADYQQALAAALLETVRQVRGLEIGTEKQLKMEFQQIAKGSIETTSASAGVKEDIYTRSKGWIESYEIINVNKPQSDQDSWKVTVLAKIPKFQSDIDNDTRKSIAIMPFRFSTATFVSEYQKQNTNAYTVSTRLKDRIQTEFTQSRKFAVLNRDYGAEFASEKALLSSDNVPASEAGRIGQMLGADFMVVGNIYNLSTKLETSSMYGLNKSKFTDSVDLSYQVIEAATQKVMWADTVTREFNRSEKEPNTVTLDKVAGVVASGIMEVIYPIKVMDILSPTEIYLNQGGDRVVVGDKFELFTQGKNLTDPDTGMQIKTDGRRTGSLIITSVLPKYAIAELVDGEFQTLSKGAIVRKLSTGTSLSEIQKNKEVRPTAGSSEAPIQW